VPYVVNAVLESGKWRGQTGARRAHHQFKRAAARMRAYTRSIRIDLTKGLN
jgi:hypothetical protein